MLNLKSFLRKSYVLLAIASIVSCNITAPNTKESRVFNIKNSLEPSPSSSPSIETKNKSYSELKSTTKKEQVLNSIDERDKPGKVSFDYIPPENLEYEAGSITVIYKDQFKFRIDKSSKKIKSIDTTISNKMNELLSKNKVKSASMLIPEVEEFKNLSEDEIENELEKHRLKVSKEYDSDIPNLKSIHYYKVDESTDLKSLCKEIRQLPFVLTAYPSPKLSPSYSSTRLSRLTSYITLPHPTEPHFSDSESKWWWFNKERVFEGWDYYKTFFNKSDIMQCPMPKIAVIDSGFDTSWFGGKDKPNYSGGMYIRFENGSYGNVIVDGSDTFQYLLDTPANIYDLNGRTFSHGTAVANIIGSPVNNNEGVGGIAPGATIMPVKLHSIDPQLISFALSNLALNNNGVDVINISLAANNSSVPITYLPDIAISMSYAIGYNKSVVVAAGNIDKTIDILGYPQINNIGEIIVGASMLDNVPYSWNNSTPYVTNKPIAWNSSQGEGSNYGNRVDVVAGGYDIYSQNYDPRASQASWYDNGGAQFISRLKGTSFATPQVSATIGMMKKIIQTLGYTNVSPKKLRSIIRASSNYYRYSGGYPSGPSYIEPKLLGNGLSDQSRNIGRLVAMRSLNVHDALVVTRNLYNYDVIVRLSNIDDTAESFLGSNVSSKYTDGNDTYGCDTLYGLSNVDTGAYISAITYNYYNGYTFGYNFFNCKAAQNLDYLPFGEAINGVSGVVGAENNLNASSGWYGWIYYIYDPNTY